jgi:hypothetical protein
MDLTAAWTDVFQNWPPSLPRRGVVVTLLNEQILFADFLVSANLLLIDRPSPDTMGARKVMVPFSQIAAVKITEVVKNSLFQPLGFQTGKPAVAASSSAAAQA